MDTLLVIAIVITALAIVVQGGILVAMYLMAKRVTTNVDGLVSETKRMLGPLEQIAGNGKTASEDMIVIGKIARHQLNHVATMLEDTHITLMQLTSEVAEEVTGTIRDIRSQVSAPFRKMSAIAQGVNTAVRVLLKREECSPSSKELRETPAA